MASEDERRRGERIPINDEFGANGGTWVSDLSRGGVFVHTDELVPVGSTVDLRFTILIDDPVVIEAHAKVVRHSHTPRGMGVQFVELAAPMRARIDELLARRQPLDSGAPLRLPEPSRGPIGLPVDDDDDESTRRVAFARPAPVEGLDLRRRAEPDLDDARTATFPRVEPGDSGVTTRFRPPPKPAAGDEDRTSVYRAVGRDDE